MADRCALRPQITVSSWHVEEVFRERIGTPSNSRFTFTVLTDGEMAEWPTVGERLTCSAALETAECRDGNAMPPAM
jgi:hypothetical protein